MSLSVLFSGLVTEYRVGTITRPSSAISHHLWKQWSKHIDILDDTIAFPLVSDIWQSPSTKELNITDTLMKIKYFWYSNPLSGSTGLKSSCYDIELAFLSWIITKSHITCKNKELSWRSWINLSNMEGYNTICRYVFFNNLSLDKFWTS